MQEEGYALDQQCVWATPASRKGCGVTARRQMGGGRAGAANNEVKAVETGSMRRAGNRIIRPK